MGFCSQFKALFKKNFIVWRRNIVGSICELLFPVILMFIIVLVRNLVSDDNIDARDYLDNGLFAYYYDTQTKVTTGPLYFSPKTPDWMGLARGIPFATCLHYNRKIIAFVVPNELYPGLRDELSNTVFSTTSEFSFRRFGNEGELEDYITAKDYEENDSKPGICAGIVIYGSPENYHVRLRYDDNDLINEEDKKQQVPNTREPIVNDLEKRPYEEPFGQYHTSGFTYLEYAISAYLAKSSGYNNIKVGLLAMRTNDYVDDTFLKGAGEFLGFIVILCYLAPIFKIVSIIVQDKELKTREGMNMMGLKDSAYWLSFLVYYIIILVILAVLLASIVVIFVFTHSNWFITFLYYLLYGISIFAFGFFISTFFNKTRVASITATMLYFASYLIADLVDSETMGETNKTAASLLPTVAAGLGSIAFVSYETGQSGVNFSNARRLVKNYRFSTALIMFFVDSIIYGLLGLYLDNVIPNANGVRKPLYFFLTKEYWTGRNDDSAKDVNKNDKEDEEKVLYPNNYFEVVGEDLKAQEERKECLSIRHLNKFFGKKHPVNDFSVNMYKGQIFALLGPNGAGKTTTISMLSGLLPVSTGSAHFAGMAIFKDMAKVREKLGVCPQHDVLFEKLTPKEHLEIFAAFKGREDVESINKDVEDILQDIELLDSAHLVACNLSGGQRRKLSIGIAFIGNSNMIFLDEPTSGIDIATRKRVWAMLKKYKESKVIILTTHYMEEAEELGDRVGIMTSGKLRCVGSPLFLKAVYGAGYNLIVSHEKTPQRQEIHDKITAFINNHIEGARVKKEADKEITYFLPKDQVIKFKSFFAELDKNLEEFKIDSYGMATNTMEDIFLRVAREDDEERLGHKLNPAMASMSMSKSIAQTAEEKMLDSYSIVNEQEPPFCQKFIIHFSAIFLKRFIISIRNWGTAINEILVPIILVVFGFALTKISTFDDSDARDFNIYAYDTPHSIMVNKEVNGIPTTSFTNYFMPEMHKYEIDYAFLQDDKASLKKLDDTIYDDGYERYGSIYINKLDTVAGDYEYIVLANMASQDSAAAYMGYFGQTLIRMLLNKPNYMLTFSTAPFPLTAKARNLEQAIKGSIVSNTLVIAFALVPAGIISFIVQEREESLKHQQLISGVSLVAYWLSNGAIDIFKSLIPCSVSIGMIYAFDIKLPYGWLFILIYAFSIIPFTYAMSFMFIKENVAQTSILLFNFFTGVVLSPVFNIFRIFDNTKTVGKVLAWIFRLFPSFCLSYGINNIAYRDLYAALDKKDRKPYLNFSVAGSDLLLLCLIFPMYLIIITLIEAQCFNFFLTWCESKDVEDNDENNAKDGFVLNEEKLCNSISLDNEPPAVLTRHLRKVYTISKKESIRAVKDLSFFINKGECLALLGTAGAGKTTTFKLVTHDIIPTRGEVFIDGKELEHNFSKVRKMFGYGPQYESAYMSMTVRENLEFYAKIKGISESIREKMIVKLINEMDLVRYEHVQMGQLSGGNKRKTTVAVALLGNPPIVILDEPSTGVDPQAKRFMWHIIQRISTKNKNTAVILSTHSMEEAEYLCTKMAIMIAGNFTCIGSPQELKEKYGKGFEIQISLPHPKPEDEVKYLSNYGIEAESRITRDELLKLFNKCGKPELEKELVIKGNAAHIGDELNNRNTVLAKVVANFLILEDQFLGIGRELAKEFGEVRVPEHIGNFFKFRVDKSKPTHTIGFLFGMLQDIVLRYGITQYSASQTSLNQIFQTFVKQSEVGQEIGKDALVIKADDKEPALVNSELAFLVPEN